MIELNEALKAMVALPVGEKLLKAISNITECGINSSDFLKRKELRHSIMEEYAHDTRISPIERSAVIDNWKTITREYANKTNIVQKAIQCLDSQKDIQPLDTDWLLLFFEKAKNISNDEMQQLWGKLLAEEAQNSGRVSKALLNALSITEGYQARCFENICQYCIDTKNGEIMILPIDEELETLACFERDVFEELDDLGYVKLMQMGYTSYDVYLLKGNYREKQISIENAEKGISIGQVSLTKMGKTLSSFIEKRYDENFINMLKEFCDKKHYVFSIT